MFKISKTIADLKINWTFDSTQGSRLFVESYEIFNKLNPELKQYAILPGKYNFYFNDYKFEVNLGIKQVLSFFIVQEIDYCIWCKQSDHELPLFLTLDRFELIFE